MARNTSSKEKTQKIVLAVLFTGLIAVALYQFVFTSPEPRKKRTTETAGGQTPSTQTTTSGQSQTTVPVQPRSTGTYAEREAVLQQELADLTPLNLSRIGQGSASASVGPRGNIFAYFVPPPLPPPKPPPPPPITVQFMQPQTAVAGTPRNFTLTITGKAFPADAQIILEGRPKPTKRVNDTTLTTEMAAAEYSSPRNMNVEVKSQSDPAKFYSNTIPFIVQAAPEPQFKYIGRLGDQGLFEMHGSKEVKRARRGESLQGLWRIDAITDQGVDLTHTQYEIRRRVPMEGKGR